MCLERLGKRLTLQSWLWLREPPCCTSPWLEWKDSPHTSQIYGPWSLHTHRGLSYCHCDSTGERVNWWSWGHYLHSDSNVATKQRDCLLSLFTPIVITIKITVSILVATPCNTHSIILLITSKLCRFAVCHFK